MLASSQVLVCAVLLAEAASAWNLRGSAQLRKRDEPFVPQRLTIPLRFDSVGRYITSVTMSPGSNQQHFNFTLSTTAGLTYVAGTQCASCSGAALYNQTKSTDATALSSAGSAPLFGQITGASVIKESCQLTQANGSAWTYPNQTIVVVNDASPNEVAQVSRAQVGKGLSGLIGLGTNKQAPSAGNSSVYHAQFQDSIYGSWLQQHPKALNFSFGMALGKPLDMPRGSNTSSAITPSGDAGKLDWLQPDSDAFDSSKLVWKKVNNDAIGQLPVSSNSTSGADWFVGLDGWVVVSGSNHITNTDSVVATVDPLYTEMYLPQSQARLIHDAIPGSRQRSDLSSLGSLSEAWTVPCDATFSFGLIVGSQTFEIDESTLLIKQANGACISSIEGWTDATQTQYLFGARFLSTVYIIFQVPQDGPNSIGFAPRSGPAGHSSHVGAIVGGVVGGVAFLVIGGFLAFFFIYRHRSQTYRITAAQFDAEQEIEKPTDGAIRPFDLQTPTSVQFATAPESTAGSSSLSPATAMSSHALLHHHDDSNDVAPPSYEVSEASRSPTTPVPVRPEKPSRSPRAANASNSSFHQPPIPLTPLSPTSGSVDGTHGTGSSTVWE